MPLGFSTYFTSSNLAGTVAAAYGFNVTDVGIASKVVNVGTCGAAFRAAKGVSRPVMQLLYAANDLTDLPDALGGAARIYDSN